MAIAAAKPKKGQKFVFNDEGEAVVDSKPVGVRFDPGIPWYNLELSQLQPTKKPVSSGKAAELEQRGLLLLQQDAERFSKSLETASTDKRMLQTLISSGTTSDRISALTLLVQESPIHAIKPLETLLSLCAKKSRNENTQSITTLKDLFLGGLLPERKLRFMKQQPCLGSQGVTDEHLMVWAFESFLKTFYFKYIQHIEVLSFDPLMFVKSQMLSTIYDLLKGKPEQEQNLLRLLVNKLGDKDNKIASKASYLILQLEANHPAMKFIVTKELERFAFAPTTSRTSHYYTMITLNQTVLTHKQIEVANLLIEIYFVFFTKLLFAFEKEENTNKEVENAEPRGAKDNRKDQKRKKDAEIRKEAQENSNSRLVSAILTGVNRAYPFAEINSESFDKHMNTLFTITHTASFNTAIQVLMLIFQASSSRDSIPDRFYKSLYESLLDPRLISSSKHSLYLNLLYKSLVIDNNVARVRAFIKRMVQVAAWQQAPLVTGFFHVIQQLENSNSTLRAMFDKPEMHEFDDDEEEVFKDIEEEEEQVNSDGELKSEIKDTKHEKKEEKPVAPINSDLTNGYDGRKRDPQYSKADRSCLWEIHPFLTHFHPTVSMLAKQLVNGEKIEGKPDLTLHTLSHFLDKFAYRNPKKSASVKGYSIMQPLAGSISKGILSIGSGQGGVPVNSDQFIEKEESEIPVDELFFHRFFNDKYIKGKQSKKKKVSVNEEGEMDEDEVWKALVDSKPNLEMEDEESDFDEEAMDEAMADLPDDEEAAQSKEPSPEADEDVDEDENEGQMFSDKETEPQETASVANEGESEDEMQLLEDEEDLLPFENDEGNESEEEEQPEQKEKTSRKNKRRKILKDLPVFADADSYAHLLSGN
ncbi:ribosome biogenesis protein Noc1 [Schizosaccharomyces cryophilus OY26]|uniref:Ribosome biogenesis protein Noc1 n=1 Tax=Schizosaccharomyces cryophilus (strain OY26 / ATCC MYA-4695 / CBS 11777 / NBRC 106824 / NRRL Y48691) TaxID=653667 RepID=S9W286_SCHCR|nr:ribosome biogenesis protein Noc1 [Schizosaccharomyces cryophilus OY26]EPY52479.1 ribosome biogenesis protein Noc1 [Schizosaccharomyces cryophilus OY26]